MPDPAIGPSLEPIAIVGMAGRFPGAADVRTYWENIAAGVETVTRLTTGEMLAAGVDPATLRRPEYVGAAGVLADVELFDAGFFRITPGEAELMDPQQRLCLECAWEAFEDAGYAPGSIEAPVGVFVGASLSTYLLQNIARRPDVLARFGGLRTLLANDKDHIATTLAHQLNLTGPAVNVSSACSTSLVAVTFACQSLWSHQVDVALAGGAAVHVPQRRGYLYERGGIYSPDGHCRAFDRQAAGTVGGSGVGLVVLKRASEALADGDHVYATIRGAAVNNDGRARVGYTAPSAAGQAAAIAEALAMAAVEPSTIGYLEAHGTGTALGDAVEIAALKEAFGSRALGPGCAVGSVKASIGHLDAAAGVASLIKTALALERRLIPPAVNFTEPNPELDLAASPFYFPTRALEWQRGLAPRRAGVSSFGMGGTNAHVVLEEAPEPLPPGASREWQLLTVSARTPGALARATRALAAHLRQNSSAALADVAYTLAVGRHEEPLRACCICADAREAADLLQHGGTPLFHGGPVPADGVPVVLLFSGDAAAPASTPSDLVDEAPFRDAVDECAAVARAELGIDLRVERTDASAERLRLFLFQYALARTLLAWGLSPHAAAGTGAGELVAAVVLRDVPLAAALRRAAAQPTIAAASIEHAADAWRDADHVVFVEIGSEGAFGSLTGRPAGAAKAVVLSTCGGTPRLAGAPRPLLETLGRLWVAGAHVDWQAFHAGQRRRRVPLPTYPFERERYWIDPPSASEPGRAPQKTRVAMAIPALRTRAIEIDRELAIRPLESYGRLGATLDALCASHAYWFLRGHGLPHPGDADGTRRGLMERLQVVPEYERLLDYLLDLLVEDGLARIEPDDRIRAGDRAEPPAPAVLEELIRRDWPEFGGLVALLAHCVAAYPRVLRAPAAAVEVLYPGASAGLLEETLGSSTVEHTWTRAAARLAGDLVASLAAGAPRPLRILEVGAGGGGLTFEAAPRAAAAGATLHVTDVSQAFVRYVEDEARRRGFDRLTFGTLDITRDPLAQGYGRGTFDVVIGLDVVHAAPDVRAALRHLDTLLAPGGVMAFVETVHADRWTNLTWGVSKAWWHFADGIRTRTPLLSADAWRSVLTTLGPGDVHVVEEPSDGSRAVRTALLVRERIDAEAGTSLAEVSALPSKQADIGDWFSVPIWVRLPPRDDGAAVVAASAWLIFADETGLASRLADELMRRGARVATVRAASCFARDAARAYRLRPGHAGDYLSLLVDLAAEHDLPDHIVHCWSVTPRGHGDRPADGLDLQARGFDSLLALMQALGVHHDGPVTLTAIANGMYDVSGEESLSPVKSLMAAAVKIVPREYPNVACRLIDITLADDLAPADQTVDLLMRELVAVPDEPMQAVRGAHRWRQTFSPVRLDAGSAEPPRIRPGGVYIVLGGLGAIGLALAGVLAGCPGVRLVLVARTPFPPRGEWDDPPSRSDAGDGVARGIARVRALEAAGAEVLIRAANVADEREMQAIVDEVRARYGAVHGVIHAAGRPDVGGVIQRRTPEATRAALEAKVRGTLVLERVLGDEPLDFMVLCSSIGAILYNLKFGEVGYVASNDFLNAFAHARARRHPGRVVAIDWTDWSEAGMWADARERLRASYATRPDRAAHDGGTVLAAATGDLLEGMTTSEACEAFRRILRHGWPQVVVSTQPLQALLDRHARFTPAGHRAFLDAVQLEGRSHERPDIEAAYVAPRTDTERRLCVVWQDLLGVNRVGIDDDFFALGGDSLLAIRIVNRLHEDFGVDSSLASLMDVPTVAALAARIEGGRAAAPAPGDGYQGVAR